MNDICIGVDLGTCYSSVGYDDSHGVQFIKDPAAPQLTYSIPSSALLRTDNAYVFGELAESEKTATPEAYRREFKRDLGSSIPYRLRDKQVLAAELSAMFLTFLVELTTTTLTAAPAATVITVPAAYDQFRRSLIDDAARRAGLVGVSLVAEPVAAVISAADRGEITDNTTILVYDLGGGTFDAAVVRLEGGRNQVLGASGLADFGGTDIDVFIEQDFARKAGDEFAELVVGQSADDPKRRARAQRARIAARELCRNIKHRLSSADHATDVLNLTIQYELSRSDLEDMVRPHLDRTVSTCQQLLASVALTPEQIDTVLLVGGTSRMPLVREVLAREFDRPVRRAADPELAVCIGATVLAGSGRSQAAGSGGPDSFRELSEWRQGGQSEAAGSGGPDSFRELSEWRQGGQSEAAGSGGPDSFRELSEWRQGGQSEAAGSGGPDSFRELSEWRQGGQSEAAGSGGPDSFRELSEWRQGGQSEAAGSGGPDSFRELSEWRQQARSDAGPIDEISFARLERLLPELDHDTVLEVESVLDALGRKDASGLRELILKLAGEAPIKTRTAADRIPRAVLAEIDSAFRRTFGYPFRKTKMVVEAYPANPQPGQQVVAVSVMAPGFTLNTLMEQRLKQEGLW